MRKPRRKKRSLPEFDAPTLRGFLDRLQGRYHRRDFLASDPLEFVHRFTDSEDPHDQELVALCSALLAYGNVRQIRRSIEALLARLGDEPARVVRTESPAQLLERLDGFVHRFNTGPDVATLLQLVARSWREHGSVGAHFARGLDPDARDFAPALDALMREWAGWSRELGVAKASSFHYFLTAPENGSCCKRWCMLLRWMGRHDGAGGLDPGLWTSQGALAATIPAGRHLRADQLVIPLDTHVSRLSRYLGLTVRATSGWKTAREVTDSLQLVDSADPTRYDFALARLGILDHCKGRYVEEVCSACDLVDACRLAGRGRAAAAARATTGTSAKRAPKKRRTA